MKIVSLLPSATEIVFALGLGEQLEGVTYECDHPAEATSKPVVSDTTLPQDRPLSAREIDELVTEHMEARQPLYKLDRDRIARIQPDLILTQDLCRVCALPTGHVEEALAQLGSDAQVVSLDPRTLGEVLDCILAVGKVTGTFDRAQDLVSSLRDRIEAVRTRASRLPSIRTLCLEWSDPPFCAGHWVPEMVDVAGGINLVSAAGEPSVRATWRQLADAGPEVIVFMPCGYYLEDAEAEGEQLFALPDFAATSAARLGGAYAVDASSFFSRPGPRIVDGLEILAWAIHPEAFPEPPADRIVRLRP